MDAPKPQQVIPVRPVAHPRPPNTWVVRGVLLAVGLGLATVFGVAFVINPYAPDGTPRSMATHQQLGMPPCNFLVLTGKPCPSCGMTTSFALLVRGDVAASMRANWAGTLLAGFWAVLMVWAFAGVVRGRMLFIRRGRGELTATLIVAAFLVLTLGRWVGVLIAL
jgi:hypothetical protein